MVVSGGPASTGAASSNAGHNARKSVFKESESSCAQCISGARKIRVHGGSILASSDSCGRELEKLENAVTGFIRRTYFNGISK
jgi:hypothetical protein